MKLLKMSVGLLCVLMLSGILMTATRANAFPSLPSTPVTLTQTPLDAWTYPFATQLSGVPAGYDVSNGVYVGWCVDLVGIVSRGSSYPAMLYSSLSPTSPPLPSELASLSWNMINYVLNHKANTATGTDIQEAIWYFCNGNLWPTISGWPWGTIPTAKAQTMVTDALTNGGSFVPGPGEIVAVICVPTDTALQDTIIELTIPGLPGLSPGYWKHNVKVYNGGPGNYSAPFEGYPHETDESMEGYAAIILGGTPTQAEIEAFLEWANGIFQSKAKADKAMWLDLANEFNVAAGYLPYSDD